MRGLDIASELNAVVDEAGEHKPRGHALDRSVPAVRFAAAQTALQH